MSSYGREGKQAAILGVDHEHVTLGYTEPGMTCLPSTILLARMGLSKQKIHE